MEDIRKLIADEVLAKGHLMSLATLDDGGVWVSDVIYVVDDDLKLYWLSNVSTRHSKAILENKNVAGTITIGDGHDGKNIGVQFAGIAEKIEGDPYDLGMRHQAKKGKSAQEFGKGILKNGQSWYRIKPTFFDLIYEPRFGFEKKTPRPLVNLEIVV